MVNRGERFGASRSLPSLLPVRVRHNQNRAKAREDAVGMRKNTIAQVQCGGWDSNPRTLPRRVTTLRDEVLSIAESTLARAVDQASRWLLWATPATNEGSRNSESITLSHGFRASVFWSRRDSRDRQQE